MHVRFGERRGLRRAVSAVYIVIMIAYLAWRVTIINPHSLLLSWTYFAAEVMGFILGLTIIFSSWSYRHRTSPAPKAGLAVDVFVPAYKEPLAIIRRTLMAATEIRYPHRTVLLDDGRREELAALARELGIVYLSRPDNTHAKAGNLNFGLAHSTAEFVAVFDADHIPRPHALDALLGFFSDPEVAMVQAPQDYYNTDAFQYLNARRTGELWHDQSFFYNIAQPCRDAMNGASCAGTSVVYRRTALDAIGGIPVETVTEDLHTSLRLHKAGRKVVYLNEPIAYGVAAVDLSEYYKTRHRWAHGNLHALRLENAAFTARLSLRQKLSYLSLGTIYLEGWQQLLLFVVPITALILGLPPFEISVFNVAVVLTFPILTTLLMQELGCGFSRYWANEIFAMARFPVHIAAAAALVRGKMAWKSSSKALKGKVHWLLLTPQIAVAVAGLVALAIGTVRLVAAGLATGPLTNAVIILAGKVGAVFGITSSTAGFDVSIDWFGIMREGYTLDLVAVAGFWALFNCMRATLVVAKAVKTARSTHDDYRFEVPALLAWRSKGADGLARVVRVSLDNIEFATKNPAGVPVHGLEAVRLHVPGGSIEVGLEDIRRQETARDGVHHVAKLVWPGGAGRERLERCLYAIDWHRDIRGRSAYFMTPSDWLISLVRPSSSTSSKNVSWLPALVRSGPGGPPRLALVRLAVRNAIPLEIRAFTPLPSGQTIILELPGLSKPIAARISIAPDQRQVPLRYALSPLGTKESAQCETLSSGSTPQLLPEASLGPNAQ